MPRVLSANELRATQVFTPEDVVEIFWKLVKHYRSSLNKVLDLGAGDGRFSKSDVFSEYLGIEIDDATPTRKIPPNAKIIRGCAFEIATPGWDSVIGNPPYLRNHFIESPWRDAIGKRFSLTQGVQLHRSANLFVYFMHLAIELTTADGFIGLLTPHEWVSRPSSLALRNLIKANEWETHIYKFDEPIFGRVMTTAAFTFIDKSKKNKSWNYYKISRDGTIRKMSKSTGTRHNVLAYSNGGKWITRRGLSPGTQAVFTINERQRIKFGLSLKDVSPCITTGRRIPKSLTNLTWSAFNRLLRDTGERCWLIRSDQCSISPELQQYLDSIPADQINTATCKGRKEWWKFVPFPVGRILVSSAFTETGPKVLLNTIGAHHVGSVYAVYAPSKAAAALVKSLRKYNFEDRIIPHSGRLKKIEVRQLNTVLAELEKSYANELRSKRDHV
ncbi:MAG: Eco57I restriction-modification methylase domain-containing protein [Luteolibacter sp.]